ncbi:MAG: extracellular solute-binding protein [Candidatus Omnitrophica bacterium]|nr:extracellular solute-binding protein [Candidatus Omnitrophota bacterium]
MRNTCLRRMAVPFALVCLCLAGCSPQPSVPSKTRTRVIVWHWMTDRQAAFDELSKRYEQATGIKVVFELFAPSEAYSSKVRAAAQGVNLPDVFGILGEKRDLASFVKAGHILPLNHYMNENNGAWKGSFLSKAVAMNEFSDGDAYGVEPGIYGVPIDMMTIRMVYNKDLLKELGGDPEQPPQSFEEFLSIGNKIKEAGMQGLVSGWGEVWLVNCLAYNLAFNIMGQDKVLATIRGEVPYTDEDWIKVFSLFKEMQDSGVLADGIVTMINKNAEQLFANGKAVFAFNGSWCVNVYKGMNPGLNYGVMLPPQVSDKYPVSIWGGAGSSFMVNARSKNKEAAVAFLKWLTTKEQQAYLSAATMSLPANKDCLTGIPDVLARFARDLELATHSYTWGISEYPQVIEAMGKGIQSIIIREMTPGQVASEVQKAKERQTARHAQ